MGGRAWELCLQLLLPGGGSHDGEMLSGGEEVQARVGVSSAQCLGSACLSRHTAGLSRAAPGVGARDNG